MNSLIRAMFRSPPFVQAHPCMSIDRATPSGSSASDIAADGWLSHLPVAWLPYALLARLDRPVGTWLLYLPGVWGISLAGAPWPDAWLLVLFGVGAVVMRGAGCVVNDFWDRDIDRQVARTAGRPLASGAISPLQALVFLAGLLAVGLLVLVQLPWSAIFLGAASLVLVVLYPLMKRVTWWPQLFLGLTFNWGVPLGFLAASGTLGWPVAVLYAAGIAWTLGYDTIYACQDFLDDAVVGVKSTARLFGLSGVRRWVAGFYAATLAALALCGALAGLSAAFFAGLLLPALHFAWQVHRLDPTDPVLCGKLFRSNRDAGLLVALALVLGRAV
jgi:4-hydroxybenzoate polyprenyltransferase